MKSRLAHIIASSIGPDGTPDKAKIYGELMLTPDAPEAFLVDAYLATEESIQVLKTAETRLLTGHSSAIKGDVDRLEKALTEHREAMQGDAKLRSQWLAVAVVVPIAVCCILLTCFWFFLRARP